MRSACSTSSARDNGHGGRWWTLRGRRNQRPPPAGTTEPPAEQEETRSPLTDSNRRPPPYHSIGNRWQPTATVLACFRRLSRFPICGRLPPVATTGLHKGSIHAIALSLTMTGEGARKGGPKRRRGRAR